MPTRISLIWFRKQTATSIYRAMNNLNPEDYDPVLHPETYKPSTAGMGQTQLLNGVEYYRKIP